MTISTNNTKGTSITSLPGMTMLSPQSPATLAMQPIGSTAMCPSTGNVYVSTGGNVQMISSSSITTGTLSGVQRSSYDTVFHTKDGRQISVSEIADFMDLMRRRMLAITPNFEAHEKYPALKEAYEQYQLIERMVLGDEQK